MENNTQLAPKQNGEAAVDTPASTMRSGFFPEASCVAATNGFVITIKLPGHPDAPDLDCLYPRKIGEMDAERWLKAQPNVQHVFWYRENGTAIDVMLIGQFSAEEQANYATRLQDTVNATGFQW